MKASGPNAEQIEYWNEVAGPKWVALDAMLDAQIAPLGARALERAALRPGERVLDVGCGCGGTSLEIARRVAPGGEVVALDISAPMLERARGRAREAGAANLRFENADAQTWRPEGEGARPFDVAFSRFGVMFFAAPRDAFANLRGALAPGGRLAFVCWQELARNPWMLEPMAAAAQHLALEPPKPGAPGPFAFADPDRVRGFLEGAGFEDVAFESVERTLVVGGEGPLEKAVDFLLQMGPAGAALRQAPPEAVPKVRDAVRAAVAPYHTSEPTPGVRMSCAAWIVTASAGRRPARAAR